MGKTRFSQNPSIPYFDLLDSKSTHYHAPIEKKHRDKFHVPATSGSGPIARLKEVHKVDQLQLILKIFSVVLRQIMI